MNRVEIVAEDKYEAQKLASLIFVKEGNETFITEIIDVFGTEIVISIKDKSAHSVVLKDKEQVVKFTDFMQSVIEKKSKIVGTSTDEEQVGMGGNKDVDGSEDEDGDDKEVGFEGKGLISNTLFALLILSFGNIFVVGMNDKFFGWGDGCSNYTN